MKSSSITVEDILWHGACDVHTTSSPQQKPSARSRRHAYQQRLPPHTHTPVARGTAVPPQPATAQRQIHPHPRRRRPAHPHLSRHRHHMCYRHTLQCSPRQRHTRHRRCHHCTHHRQHQRNHYQHH